MPEVQEKTSGDLEIRELIKKLRMDPRADNKPVLAVRLAEMQRGKNGGFPKHMYHETLEPVCDVDSEQVETALAQRGYVTHYIKRTFPKWQFRRNFDPKFAAYEFIEAVTVANQDQLDALKKRAIPKSAGPWCGNVVDLEPLPENSEENKDLEIARLEGALAEAREKRGKKDAA